MFSVSVRCKIIWEGWRLSNSSFAAISATSPSSCGERDSFRAVRINTHAPLHLHLLAVLRTVFLSHIPIPKSVLFAG